MVHYIMDANERWIELYSVTRPLRLHNQSGLIAGPLVANWWPDSGRLGASWWPTCGLLLNSFSLPRNRPGPASEIHLPGSRRPQQKASSHRRLKPTCPRPILPPWPVFEHRPAKTVQPAAMAASLTMHPGGTEGEGLRLPGLPVRCTAVEPRSWTLRTIPRKGTRKKPAPQAASL